MSDKIYVGSGRAINTQYGELLKLSFTEEDLNTLRDNLENGWVNLNLNKRREPSEKGVTHYMTIDTWKPDGSKASAPADSTDSSDDQATAMDVPF